MLLEGEQSIITPTGHTFSLVIGGGLCYLPQRFPTNHEMRELPQVLMISIIPWVPSIYNIMFSVDKHLLCLPVILTGTHEDIYDKQGNDGSKVANDHCNITLGKIDCNIYMTDNEYDITNVETNDDVMYYSGNNDDKISPSASVIGTDMDVGYELGVLDTKISSIHAPHKEPVEAHIAVEKASKETDIDVLINDMNIFLVSTEPHITSGMLYKALSLENDKGTDRDDGYKVNTTLETSMEIEETNNDEVTNEFDIDMLINNVKKSFLSEATKKDTTKDVIATTFLYNGDYLLSSKNIDYHHPYPDEIGTEWQAPDTNSPCTVGITELVGVPMTLIILMDKAQKLIYFLEIHTALDLKSCYLVIDQLSGTAFYRIPSPPKLMIMFPNLPIPVILLLPIWILLRLFSCVIMGSVMVLLPTKTVPLLYFDGSINQ